VGSLCRDLSASTPFSSGTVGDIREFLRTPEVFLRHMGYTLITTAIGFFLAVVLGIVLAVGIVYSRFLERTVYTLPRRPQLGAQGGARTAVRHLARHRLGAEDRRGRHAGDLPDRHRYRAGLAVGGSGHAEPGARHAASALQVLLKIRFPNALPSLFAGMKVAISFALVGAIVGEFVAGGNGLGFLILVAQGQFDTTRVFVSLVLLGLMGTLLFYGIDFLERLMLPWHVSQRPQAGAASAGG
jgi:NitT/TauT family transport system permease protein